MPEQKHFEQRLNALLLLVHPEDNRARGAAKPPRSGRWSRAWSTTTKSMRAASSYRGTPPAAPRHRSCWRLSGRCSRGAPLSPASGRRCHQFAPEARTDMSPSAPVRPASWVTWYATLRRIKARGPTSPYLARQRRSHRQSRQRQRRDRQKQWLDVHECLRRRCLRRASCDGYPASNLVVLNADGETTWSIYTICDAAHGTARNRRQLTARYGRRVPDRAKDLLMSYHIAKISSA